MRRLGEERGIALAVALAVLLVATLLGAAAITLSTQTSRLTNRDAQGKTALEAADAGQRVAVYRLNMVRPDDSKCVTSTSPYVASPTGGYCSAGPESVGTNASFTYSMTPALATGASCSGQPVQSSTGITQRCLTVIGTANGVSARTETRVAAFGAQPLFPVPGLLGTNGVSIANNATINGTAGSNGTIALNNNATVSETVTGPAGNVTIAPGAAVTTQDPKNPTPFVLSPVDPGTSATVNDNNRITNCASHTIPYDPCNGVTLSAGRVLSFANNASLTLGGGTYNFCGFSTGNNVTVTLGPLVKTRIFIDSPDRPGSGCAAGTGSFSFSNGSNFINASTDVTALQIYVYGWNNGLNVVDFSNNAITYATLYAPLSTVNLTNNATTYAGVAAKKVNVLNNMTFNWATNAGGLQARSTGLYYRTAWEQCPAAPSTAGQPQSGC